MRIWISAAVLLVVAALGLALAPRAIDWNAYRPDIERAAAELFGHDVTISGPIELDLLPRLTVTAKDVTVASGDDDRLDFELAANQAEVTLKIGPLLAGSPVVRDLRLRRPVLTLTEDSAKRLRSWPPRWQDWAAPLAKLDLEGISIANGRVDLSGEFDDADTGIRDLSLDLRINEPGRPVQAAGLFKTKRHSFTYSAEFGRPDREGASAAKLLIEAQNGIDERTSLRLSGRVVPDDKSPGFQGRVTLSGPDLQHGLGALAAATGYPSTFRFLAGSQPFAIEGQLLADREGIRAEALQLRIADKTGKAATALQLHPSENFDLLLELPTLQIADEAGFDDFLPLDVLSKLRVPPGAIEIRLREIAYRGNSARQASLKLKTDLDRVTKVEEAKALLPGLIDIRFEGQRYPADIGSRLSGRLAAVGDDLKSALVWLGLAGDLDQEGWRTFNLEGDLDISSVEIALNDVDMRLDSSTLKGKAALRFSERQRLSIDVDVDRPNLDLYSGDWAPRELASALNKHLIDVDAAVDARFKRLIWRGIHVEEGTIQASAEQGRITLGEMKAKTVGNTEMSLAGTIDLGAEGTDLLARLESEQPSRALRRMKIDLPLRSSRVGPIELTASIKGKSDRLAIDTKATYDGGNADVAGEAGWIGNRPWYNLMANVNHPDHQALLGQFGLTPLVPAGDADGPLELAGRLRYEADAPWMASGSIKLGPTTFTGSLSYQDAPFDSPFEAKLSVGVPKKDSLAPFLILTGLRFTGDLTPASWLGRLPEGGLRTRWLEAAEGSLSLASKGGLAGDNLVMKASLKDGLLYIEQLEARPWQGTLKAELTLERRRDQPFLAVAADLDQVEAADVASWLGIRSGITGPLDLHLEASSTGRTAYELMAGLAGDLELTLGPGELKGLGISGLRQVLADQTDADAVRADRSFSLTLPFDEIATRADLSRGILTFKDGRLRVSSGSEDAVAAGLAGEIDLLLWIVNLSVTAETDPFRIYRVVGPPSRPYGLISAGN